MNETTGTVTELRVHGVGGTTAGNVLDDPRPEQMSGDELAGFFRRRAPQPAEESDVPGEVAAYSWGGLNSRAGARAIWLLLLPFALANVAGYLVPPPSGRKGCRAVRVAEGVVRALGLILTLWTIVWVAGITVDLLSYQCGGSPACRERRWFLAVFRYALIADHPLRRVTLGLVGPLLLLAVLWVGIGRSQRRYERYERPGSSPENDGLSDDRFWAQPDRARALLWLHLAASFAVLGYITAVSVVEVGGRAGGISAGLAWLGLGVVLASLVTAAVSATPRQAWGLTLLLTGAAVLLTAGIRAWTVVTDPGLEGLPQPLPGVTGANGIVLRLHLGALVLLLAALLIRRWRAGSSPGPGFRVAGSLVVGVVAHLLLFGFMAGTTIRTADYVGRPEPVMPERVPLVPDGDSAPRPGTTGTDTVDRIYYRSAYEMDAFAWLAGLVGVVAVSAAGLGIGVLRRRPGITAALRRQFQADLAAMDGPDRQPARREALFQRAVLMRCLAPASDCADLVLTAFVVSAALYLPLRTVVNSELPSLLVTLGTWGVTAVAAGAFVLVRRSMKSRRIRRTVGILWDVTSFWPRHYHPFAPPAYAERAVPELAQGLAHLAADGHVVISAHSQGAVLAAAALLQLDLGTRSRVVLITHGSPLTRLYARYFPAYVSPGRLRRLGETLGPWEPGAPGVRWLNCFRPTDPIGGPQWPRSSAVTDVEEAGAVADALLPDPASFRDSPRGEVPAVLGHSGYYTDPFVTSVIHELRRRLARRSPRPSGREERLGTS